MYVYPCIKNFSDRIVASIAIVFLAPVLFTCYLLVRWRFGAPALFLQQRPGYKCRPFLLLKFRTMTSARDSSGALLPDIQRLSTFGGFLRSTSLDELPELLNIVRGEMSFVGPRPLLMQYLPLYSSEQSRRHDVKPGFSGWAQINGRNAISWDEKLKLDIWYVDNRSFFLDLKIIFITIFKVAFRQDVTTSSGDLMPVFKGSQPSSHSS